MNGTTLAPTPTSPAQNRSRNLRRAVEQAADYRCSLSAIRLDGERHAVVFVRNERNGAIYTVPTWKGARCNCPHSQQRLKGTAEVCKHTHLANAFLANHSPADGAPVQLPTVEDAPAPAPKRLTTEDAVDALFGPDPEPTPIPAAVRSGRVTARQWANDWPE